MNDGRPEGLVSSDLGSSSSSLITTISAWIVHLTALMLAAATLVLAGQPIYANDTWVHLALGEAFAEQGPWLQQDPHLFAAAGPPSPSSWLGSVAIHSAYRFFGFTGVRIGHVIGALAILVIAWRGLRRAGTSPTFASAGFVGFVVLSTYRLAQLRPDLFTIGATLSLYPLLLASRSGPERIRTGIACCLMVVWSNIHAAFILGPVLVLLASAVGMLVAILPHGGSERKDEAVRARRLATAGVWMTLAGLVNPQGPTAYLAYFHAGTGTLALESVVDEWGPTRLLTWPVPFLPPTLAAWLMTWVCVFGVAWAAAHWARERFLRRGDDETVLDPVLLGLAAAGIAAAVFASRFLWLGIFALASIAQLAARSFGQRSHVVVERTTSGVPPEIRSSTKCNGVPRAGAIALAIAVTTIGTLHFWVGDWPLVSRSMRADDADYGAPYPTERFNAHAIWFLADTGVEGRIFNDYPLGGFMSFWLSPRLRMASSGSMNVSKDAMEANLAIGSRQQLRADEDFGALLDRMGFDLFLGLGVPIPATPGRPVPCTVRHLEHEPGWLLVFRNLRNAVYLRKNERNARNLERIAAYYARAGVPFDRERGFEAEQVIRKATPWALAHGLIPFDFEALVENARTARREGRIDGQVHRLAVLYATLGLYERALQIDRFIQEAGGPEPISAWRLLWCLVQLDRWDEALALATDLDRKSAKATESGTGAWSAPLEKLRSADLASRASQVAQLPMLRPERVDWVRHGIAIAPARFRHPDPSSRP